MSSAMPLRGWRPATVRTAGWRGRGGEGLDGRQARALHGAVEDDAQLALGDALIEHVLADGGADGDEAVAPAHAAGVAVVDVVEMADDGDAVEAGPGKGEKEAGLHVGVDDVGAELADGAAEAAEGEKHGARGAVLIDDEDADADGFDEGDVTALVGEEGDGVAGAPLIDGDVDGEVDDAVAAVGEAVDDVEDAHAVRRPCDGVRAGGSGSLPAGGGGRAYGF